MEGIIKSLLQPDTELITKATAELNEAFKRPESIPALCELTVGSQDAAVRQMAAKLLTRRFGKLRTWNAVPAEHQELIRNGILQAIQNEPEKTARTAMTGFIGVLVRHEFERNKKWEQQVLSIVFDNISSADPARSQLAAETFAVLCDTAPHQMIKHLDTILNMYQQALTVSDSTGNLTSPTLYQIIIGMAHLVTYCFGVHTHMSERVFIDTTPTLLKCCMAFSVQDEEQFIKTFDVFEELADANSKVLVPHIKLIVESCVQLAKNPELDDGVRVKALTFIGWLVRMKKKQFIKNKLVEPLIYALFELMATVPADDDVEEEYFGSNEISTPATCAAQTLDVLALHVPPKQLIPTLLAILEPRLQSPEKYHRKASYLCIAVIAEGCSEAIASKYIRPLLDCVKVGIVDPEIIVRNAALFALGQFAEHLQPEISTYADEILPLLFQFLNELCAKLQAGETEPPHTDRIFYAVETFCENLESALVPHVPALMEFLLKCLEPNKTVHLRELAMSLVTAVTNAAKTHMLPYLQTLTDILNPYLVVTEDENICALRHHAVNALAALARQIGRENFLAIAAGTMNIGLTLLDDNDPDLRAACYNLFASIASVVHEEMASAPMEKIVKAMCESVKSTEGIIPTFNEDEDDNLDLVEAEAQNENDEIDIENSDGEEDDDVAAYSVENAYMDEKEEAIVALAELAEHTGPAFAPYIQICFEEVYKQVNFPNEDIRRAAIDTLKQFVIALYKLKNEDGARSAVLILVPKLSEIIHTDDERQVVMSALDAYSDILKELRGAALSADGQKEAIFKCIMEVLHGKVQCQYDEPTDEEQEESEFDEAIIQTAGDILPRFGLALTPQEFAMYFSKAFSYFIHKIEKTKHKDETTDSQRAFAVGVLSECFAALKEQTAQWFDTLLPIFLSCVRDRNDEVRNNTIFGLGEMVIHAGQIAFKYYPQILTTLSHSVASEKHPGTLDNICGALARLIMANTELVPLKDVLPVFVQYLPLREDYDENLAVFKCLMHIFQQGKDEMVPLIERITVVGITVLVKKQYSNDEAQELITNFLRLVQQQFPEQFKAAAGSDPEFASYSF